eukprot:4582533-Ditylum_brightwellii.AAC.1
MPFGWVMGLPDATTLITHSGAAFGHMSLFHAEGYRLMSVSCFLHHLHTYTQLTSACNTQIYIDNKGVVTRANNQIEYEFNFPYNTLKPD